MENPKKPSIYCKNLPSSALYEKSFMHLEPIRKVISHPKHNLVSTLSCDGVLKLWTKRSHLVEFCKKFKIMSGTGGDVKVSPCRDYAVTLSVDDDCFRVLDLVSKEIVSQVAAHGSRGPFSFLPTGNRLGFDLVLWKTDSSLQRLRLKDASLEPVFERSSNVRWVEYWAHARCWALVDDAWHADVIDSKTGKMARKESNSRVRFDSKFDTDLFALRKRLKSDGLLCAKILQKKSQWAVLTGRVELVLFDLPSAKSRRVLQLWRLIAEFRGESPGEDAPNPRQSSNNRGQEFEFGVDKYERMAAVPSSGGVAYVNLESGEVEGLAGAQEKSLRLMGVSVFQGRELRREKGSLGKGGQSSQEMIYDPNLFCWADHKSRFYIFSNRRPVELKGDAPTRRKGFAGRDTMNENVKKDRFKVLKRHEKARRLATKVMISTSMGNIFLRLFAKVL